MKNYSIFGFEIIQFLNYDQKLLNTKELGDTAASGIHQIEQSFEHFYRDALYYLQT